MPRTFAITMTRPHELMGFPQPLSRRLPTGMVAWNIALLCASFIFGVFYVIQVNAATSKGYALSRLEKQIEGLTNETMALQDKTVVLSSMEVLTRRASELGFAPADRVEYIKIAPQGYALAH